jgi:hypothetical protein
VEFLPEEIIQQLQKGVSPEEIGRSLMPPAERELLKRCASVRSFDERLVDQVLRDGVEGGDPDALPFERIVGHRVIERIPRTKGLYQVTEDARPDYFKAWWEGDGGEPAAARHEVPPALRALSERLVTFYEDAPGEGDLDRLYHLIAVNRLAARNLLNKLYRDADQEFDRALCRDLLNLLDARHDILGPELSESRDYYSLYFKARSFWANEYYHSANYFERKNLRNKFEAFLRDGSQWILNLQSAAGMGKTMFVRWLIARRCVPEPARFPCALIDFDNPQHDPVRFTHEPWLLLLALATQLDEQIERRPFYEFITELQERQRHAPLGPREHRAPSEDSRRFADALLDSKLDRPVFIIFDTLEEAVTRRSADARALIDQVALLRARFPPLRLLLSGRCDLGRRLPGFARRFHKEMLDVSLRPLKPDEARGYLKLRLRQSPGPAHGVRVEAVLDKSQGDPFKLAFFSDLLAEPDQRVSPSQIMETDDPVLASLLKRVIDRVEDKRLRWLLRYGVVLRELSLPAIKEVLAPYLRHAGAGKTELDDPDSGLVAPRQVALPTPPRRLEPRRRVQFRRRVGITPRAREVSLGDDRRPARHAPFRPGPGRPPAPRAPAFGGVRTPARSRGQILRADGGGRDARLVPRDARGRLPQLPARGGRGGGLLAHEDGGRAARRRPRMPPSARARVDGRRLPRRARAASKFAGGREDD